MSRDEAMEAVRRVTLNIPGGAGYYEREHEALANLVLSVEQQTAKRCAEIARAVAVDHEAVFAELERYSVGSDFRSTSQTAHGIADRIRCEFGITEGV